MRFAKDSTYENTESVGDEGGCDKYLTSDAVVGSEFGPDSDGCAKQGEAVAEEAPRDDGSADGDENSVCVEEAHSENSGSPSSRTNPPSSSIHVANIPDGTTENEIKHLFQRSGRALSFCACFIQLISFLPRLLIIRLTLHLASLLC